MQTEKIAADLCIKLFDVIYNNAEIQSYDPKITSVGIHGIFDALRGIKFPAHVRGEYYDNIVRVEPFTYFDTLSKKEFTSPGTLLLPTRLGNILVFKRPIDGRPAMQAPVYVSDILRVAQGAMDLEELMRLFGIQEYDYPGVATIHHFAMSLEGLFLGLEQQQREGKIQ